MAFLLATEKDYCHGGCRAEDVDIDVGRIGSHGRPIRRAGPSDLVGVQLGYYGAHHLLCDVRHVDSLLRLLCPYQTGINNCHQIVPFSLS